MEDSGPVVHFWTMPAERKNRDLKKKARATECAKNLPLTIAIRDQLDLSFLRECVDSVTSRVEFGNILSHNADDEVKCLNLGVRGTLNSKSYSYVELDGIKFSLQCVFIKKVGAEPIFAKLEKIYEIKGEVFFLGVEIVTKYFSSFDHAYVVELNETPDTFVDIRKIPWVYPPLLVKRGNKYFISMRYD
ncbi:hypothetical protein QAD02_008746 [Eretmocerus hayati]|uniref:Uncharacterized protein n=1 Tax=Eretmocerus hayati TaxID=131215 RepID=A0ACC2N9T3_9HYME|nr:hypothetical protein QAD02_008746 [Eretmocerus hayati]